MAAPAADVAQILTVVEEAGEEGVLGDATGGFGGDGSDAGDLAELVVADVLPAAVGDTVGDQDHHFGATQLARTGGHCGEGVGEVPLERLRCFRFP